MWAKPYSFRKAKKMRDKLSEKVFVVPTDTVVGLISKSPNLIYEIKNRPSSKKLVLFVSKIQDIKNLTPIELGILKKYWPGKLTIIKDGKSYRMPKHRKLLRLIKLMGPLYSTSANISGNKPIKKTIDAYDEFKNHLSKIVVVKGKQNNVYPSTIVNFDDFTILRRGSVDGQEIVKKLQESIE